MKKPSDIELKNELDSDAEVNKTRETRALTTGRKR